jgi:hypothetical protein
MLIRPQPAARAEMRGPGRCCPKLLTLEEQPTTGFGPDWRPLGRSGTAGRRRRRRHTVKKVWTRTSPRSLSQPASSMANVSIRHVDIDELDKPAVAKTETADALRAWWNRWKTLPVTERDRPVADVLAEERDRD